MNGNVTHIVDLIFRDIEESEEVLSIREEVLNNCQERYDNLIISGYGEEEALAAVAESLKGMDEVLKDYPRKKMYTEEDFSKENSTAPGCDDRAVICWDAVHALKINVRNAKVEVLEAEGRASLELRQGSSSILRSGLEGDTLVISQEVRTDTSGWSPSNETGLLGSFIKMVGAVVGSFPDGDECGVKIRIPSGMLHGAKIQTLSGEIIFEASAGRIDLQTTSGDCRVRIPGAGLRSQEKHFGYGSEENNRESAFVPEIRIKTISGDIDARGHFAEADMTTTSGDIDFDGSAGQLRFKTVSGDIEAQTHSAKVAGTSVSGDIDLLLKEDGAGDADLSTVSGDIEVEVPNADGISAEAVTRSGDVNYYNISLRDDAPLKMKLRSVSGDVTVQG